MTTLSGGHRPVLWDEGAPMDLNTLISADSGWILEIAKDINDRGQIVGGGRLSAENHAFLRTPRTD